MLSYEVLWSLEGSRDNRAPWTHHVFHEDVSDLCGEGGGGGHHFQWVHSILWTAK